MQFYIPTDGKPLIENTITCYDINISQLGITRLLTGHRNGIVALWFYSSESHIFIPHSIFECGDESEVISLYFYSTSHRSCFLSCHLSGRIESWDVNRGVLNSTVDSTFQQPISFNVGIVSPATHHISTLSLHSQNPFVSPSLSVITWPIQPVHTFDGNLLCFIQLEGNDLKLINPETLFKRTLCTLKGICKEISVLTGYLKEKRISLGSNTDSLSELCHNICIMVRIDGDGGIDIDQDIIDDLGIHGDDDEEEQPLEVSTGLGEGMVVTIEGEEEEEEAFPAPPSGKSIEITMTSTNISLITVNIADRHKDGRVIIGGVNVECLSFTKDIISKSLNESAHSPLCNASECEEYFKYPSSIPNHIEISLISSISPQISILFFSLPKLSSLFLGFIHSCEKGIGLRKIIPLSKGINMLKFNSILPFSPAVTPSPSSSSSSVSSRSSSMSYSGSESGSFDDPLMTMFTPFYLFLYVCESQKPILDLSSSIGTHDSMMLPTSISQKSSALIGGIETDSEISGGIEDICCLDPGVIGRISRVRNAKEKEQKGVDGSKMYGFEIPISSLKFASEDFSTDSDDPLSKSNIISSFISRSVNKTDIFFKNKKHSGNITESLRLTHFWSEIGQDVRKQHDSRFPLLFSLSPSPLCSSSHNSMSLFSKSRRDISYKTLKMNSEFCECLVFEKSISPS
ncbi:hypothetical protein ADUPG1_011906, partial [Aduncisulcus paluster]